MFDRYLRYIAADGPELFASLGVGKKDIEGRTAAEAARPENRDRVERAYRKALAGESSEFEAERKGRILRTRVAPVLDGDMVVAGIALMQDVTEEREHAAALARAKSLFEATMSNIRDGVVLIDSNRRVLLANRAYADYTAMTASGYTLPSELTLRYTPSINVGSGTVPAFTVTFTAIGTQLSDGDLTFNSTGQKLPIDKW